MGHRDGSGKEVGSYQIKKTRRRLQMIKITWPCNPRRNQEDIIAFTTRVATTAGTVSTPILQVSGLHYGYPVLWLQENWLF